MCVCSDETVGDLDGKNVDEFVTYAYESGLPTESDPKEIAKELRAPANGTQIVFTTYQSGKIIAEAARRAGVTFDFAIFDEAHRTAGKRNKPFARLLRDSFKAKRRMFMTATERVVSGDRDEVYSMEDEQVYGKRFHYLSFGEAIKKRLISPFQVLLIGVSEREVRTQIERNRILNVSGDLDEVKARDLAVSAAILDALKGMEL